ncbi:MAG TPA: class I SAM-dependent methyltransferase [Acidobacteriota bacterium]|nr:class I SAM-dependent methyltransferase [Acidobacteriota bacterium]HRR56904.1 class I SAM-dependent methyltransferase [Acidobacteriota bacterium]HRV08727.1 class I SAM-dependent methyltransferase [Acidobacteriota bacterium]
MRRCPVCEYPACQVKWLLGDRFFRTTEERFELFECPACGLLFQDPSRDNLASSTWYPPAYWWVQKAGPAGRLEARYREWVVENDQLNFLRKLFPNPKGLRLLDVGTGSGLFVEVARRYGFVAEGLEPAEGTEGVTSSPVRPIRRVSVDDLINEGYRCDIVTMFHVLEHVADPFSFLRKVRELLDKPGHLIVQVPNRASLQADWFGPRWYGLDCPRHLCNFTEHALLHLLGRAGFRIRRRRHFSLRDNAPAIVSSLLPDLDPMSWRVRRVREGRTDSGLGTLVRELAYFCLVAAAQIPAVLEAAAGRGGTVTVYATWDV